MQKIIFPKTAIYLDLPLSELDNAGFSVFVLDKNWNYLYINRFVEHNLGERGKNLMGKNIWETFPELLLDVSFRLLRERTEQGMDSNFITISPLTSQKINVTGQLLGDCFLFTSSVIPKKEDIIAELRNSLNKRKV